MDFSNKAYSDIKIVTVDPFYYIRYAVISSDPEGDAISHVESWARHLKIMIPHTIGWNFPHVSQEQSNIFHMHGYAAALILNGEQDAGDIDTQVILQDSQRCITLTLEKIPGEEFTLIANAYKALLSYMAIN